MISGIKFIIWRGDRLGLGTNCSCHAEGADSCGGKPNSWFVGL